MHKFKYKAVNIEKRVFSGTFMAESEDDLRKLLSDQNLYLIKSKMLSDKGPNAFFTMSGRVKMSELTHFCRQFSIMINAGVSIIDCLAVLKDQSYSSYFRKILAVVHEDVLSGLLLSEAMKKHPKVFPDFFHSMTHVGEMSGALDKVLVNLADYYEKDSKIRKKAKSAMIYPLTLLAMLVAVLAVMIIFVIPTFQESLSRLEVDMPAITTAIFNFSTFIAQNWKFILLAIIVLILVFYLAKKSPKGRLYLDKLKLHLPLIKTTQISMASSRFARGFGILLSSGMDIVNAMEIISNVIGNKDIENRFKMAINDVKRGMSLTLAFNSYKLFPDILVQMVSVGEKTGALDEVLLRSCSYFDEQVENAYNTLTSSLQPIMLLIMGGTIGFVFVGIYAPMLSIMQTL